MEDYDVHISSDLAQVEKALLLGVAVPTGAQVQPLLGHASAEGRAVPAWREA